MGLVPRIETGTVVNEVVTLPQRQTVKILCSPNILLTLQLMEPESSLYLDRAANSC